MGVGAGVAVFASVAIADTVYVNIGCGVVVLVAFWVKLGSGVELCTTTAGFGNAVGVGDGPQAAHKYPSAMAKSRGENSRSSKCFISMSRRTILFHLPYAIIMGS